MTRHKREKIFYTLYNKLLPKSRLPGTPSLLTEESTSTWEISLVHKTCCQLIGLTAKLGHQRAQCEIHFSYPKTTLYIPIVCNII